MDLYEDISLDDINEAVERSMAAETAFAERHARRRNSMEREHKERGKKLSELARLRHQAVRLSKRAGLRVRYADLQAHTRNQLHNVIREAHALIALKESS